MATPKVPQYHELMWPALTALRELGGSATVKEMYERVVEDEHFSEEQQAVSTKDGRMSEIEYRLHWARTHLKGIGAIANSARGVWTLTDKGKTITPEQMRADTKAYRDEVQRRAKRKHTHDGADDEDGGEGSDSVEGPVHRSACWSLPPDGFERLAQTASPRGRVRQRHRVGQERRRWHRRCRDIPISLVSFPVYFQCKRYKGIVTPELVRDFRGAMAGRGEKGLLITTGSFTREAQAEATRDGAPPVELIDGDRLCDLLREYNLGVEVRQRIEEDVLVNPAFFDEYGLADNGVAPTVEALSPI